MRQRESSADDYTRAMDAALKLLSYRHRTGREMTKRLLLKGFSRDVAERVRGRLEEIGYLDDRQFGAAWVRSHSGARCRNAWLLKKDLVQRGIREDVADEIVNEHWSESEVFEAACELVRKRLRGKDGRDTENLKNRIQNLLLRRGFGYDFIREVLKRVQDEW